MFVYCGVTGFEDVVKNGRCPSCGGNVVGKYTDSWYEHTVIGDK